jgi:hypothetical protein
MSIEERYPSKEEYLAKAQAAAEALVKGGYLLAADTASVMARIDAQWKLH